MSANTTLAPVVPAPVIPAPSALPLPEGNTTPTGNPTPLTVPAASSLDVTIQAAPPPMAASPSIDTIKNMVATDNGPLKRKASHKPRYLKYDEEKFKQNLRQLIDPSQWAEGHRDMNKAIVHVYSIVSWFL